MANKFFGRSRARLSSLKVELCFFLYLLLISSSCSQNVQTPAEVRLDTPEKTLIYLESQIRTGSENLALVAYSVAEDGSPASTDTSFFYNAETPLPLASTFKIIVLAAYAQAVSEGALDADEAISVDQWEAYYLPLTDGGAHSAALEAFGIPHDELGFAAEEANVTLNQLAFAMIRFSGNAATDYLIERLGGAALERVINENNLSMQDVPISILGTLLTLYNHERSRPTNPPTYEELKQDATRYQDLYLNDSAWREAQLEWLQSPSTTLGSYDEQVKLFQSFVKGSAADYARIMAGVITQKFISPEVSRLMGTYLEWPMALKDIEAAFETLGTKGGNLPGILTEASYLIPKSGDFAGQPRVVVLFMNKLPETGYTDLNETFSQQQLMLNLATQRDLIKRLKEGE